jgi:hypothetical protein
VTPRDDVERALGRPLTEQERTPVGRLDDLPESARAVAAALPGILRKWYLRSLVDDDERPFVDSYIEDVIDGEGAHERWGRGGLLLPTFGLPDLLTRDVADILAAFPLDGGAWRRWPVTRERWDARDGLVGAPAVDRPDLGRHVTLPPHVMRVRSDIALEPEPAPERLARRWIASRVARLAPDQDPEATVRATFVDLGALSADARTALAGLAREQREIGPAEDAVPGFRGPDDWYD